MTPEEVIRALFTDDVDAIRRASTPGFREHVTAEEMRRVLQAIPSAQGPPDATGPSLVLHDTGLELANSPFHVQIVYEGEAIAGLVVKPGPPTGRFGE